VEIIIKNESQVHLLPIQTLISVFASVTSMDANYMADFLCIRRRTERHCWLTSCCKWSLWVNSFIQGCPWASWQMQKWKAMYPNRIPLVLTHLLLICFWNSFLYFWCNLLSCIWKKKYILLNTKWLNVINFLRKTVLSFVGLRIYFLFH